MKKLWVLSLILCTVLFVSCMTILESDLTPEQARIVEIIKCPGLDKTQLFVLANSWAVDAFVSAKSVIEFSDKEAGIIKGKYIINFSEDSLWSVYTIDIRSTLTIEVKDGAARIIIADPCYRETNYPLENAARFNDNCLPKYHNLIASFKKAIQETSGGF